MPPIDSREQLLDLVGMSMKHMDVEPARMADEFGHSVSSIYRWMRGESAPYRGLWQVIADWIERALEARLEELEEEARPAIDLSRREVAAAPVDVGVYAFAAVDLPAVASSRTVPLSPACAAMTVGSVESWTVTVKTETDEEGRPPPARASALAVERSGVCRSGRVRLASA